MVDVLSFPNAACNDGVLNIELLLVQRRSFAGVVKKRFILAVGIVCSVEIAYVFAARVAAFKAAVANVGWFEKKRTRILRLRKSADGLRAMLFDLI